MKSKITEEELQLFEELKKEKESDWKTFQKEDYKGLWDGIVNKYPESAHFIYELLQNADDAKASSIRLTLCPDSLIVSHNGTKHFDIKGYQGKAHGDVNAILSAGNTNKDGINSIGKFGIGFKSVFAYSSSPEVYDDKFRFKIENYIVPEWINKDHPQRCCGETLFYIPFKNPERHHLIIYERIKNLSSPILFLKNLREVIWTDELHPGEEHIYRKETKRIFNMNGTQCCYVCENDGGDERCMYMFSREVDVPNYPKQEVCVGYYLKKDENQYVIDNVLRPKVYCYFPTSQQFGMCFVSHAPFETTDNRDNFLPDSDINKILTDSIFSLAADAIPILCSIAQDNKQVLKEVRTLDILPWDIIKKKINYWHSCSDEELLLYNYMTDVVKNKAVILTERGNYKRVEDIYMLESKEFKSILTINTFKQLIQSDNCDYIERVDNNYYKYLTDVLRLKTFNHKTFANLLNGDFLASQSKKWLRQFYEFIKDEIEKYSHCPLIFCNNGSWEPLKKEDESANVFLPYDKDNKENLNQTDFNYVSKEFLDDEDLIKAIEGLGISYPKFLNVLETAIIPKYREVPSIEDAILKKDFNIILDNYDKKENEEEKNDILSLLKQKFKIVGIDDYLHLCNDLLLDTHSEEIQGLFKEGKVPIVDIPFYVGDDEHKKNDARELLKEIGLSEDLMIVEYEYYDGKRNGKESAKSCDFMIFGQKDIEVSSSKSSLFLWNSIVKNFKSKMVYRYRGFSSQYYEMKVQGMSSILIWLCNNKWIFDESGRLYNPSEITKKEFYELGYNECSIIEPHLNFSTHSSKNGDNNDLEDEVNNHEEEVLKDKLFKKFGGNHEKIKEFLRDPDNKELSIEEYERQKVSNNLLKYIGRSLFREYITEKQHKQVIEGDFESEVYDFRIDNTYIFIHTTDYSFKEETKVPLRISMQQLRFMQNHKGAKFRIVRISLKDLDINHERQDRIYGKNTNIASDVSLQQFCENQVSSFWKDCSSRNFENKIAQFNINITEIIEHVKSHY